MLLRWAVSLMWRIGRSGCWQSLYTTSDMAPFYPVSNFTHFKVPEMELRPSAALCSRISLPRSFPKPQRSDNSCQHSDGQIHRDLGLVRGGETPRQFWIFRNICSRVLKLSGTMAWRLGGHQAHLIVMWSIPYNLNIFNSYFAVGMVKLNSKFRQEGAVGELSLS